jgi:hypothetical protein
MTTSPFSRMDTYMSLHKIIAESQQSPGITLIYDTPLVNDPKKVHIELHLRSTGDTKKKEGREIWNLSSQVKKQCTFISKTTFIPITLNHNTIQLLRKSASKF